MNGFDKKSIHLYHDADNPAQITIETDFMDNGDFQVYQKITVDSGSYVHYEFQEASVPNGCGILLINPVTQLRLSITLILKNT